MFSIHHYLCAHLMHYFSYTVDCRGKRYLKQHLDHDVNPAVYPEYMNIYVENESAGKFEVARVQGSVYSEPEQPKFYNNRVNDGSDLTIAEAVENTGSKWVNDDTVQQAEHFMKNWKYHGNCWIEYYSPTVGCS